MMKYITGNPYDGARRAFLNLHPFATAEDWDEWCFEHMPNNDIDEEGLIALSATCHTCAAKMGHMLDEAVLKHVCYSAGYLEALLSERFGQAAKAP
ncbi:MAG: hypothetical protein ABJK59_13580 [Erythrobacter sp.]|uniref:hypothetical protein n=1 Tax=Erythrobacter sp. TaxID=1042 RepID=UPI003299857C